jgi:hypothetical protein
MEAPGDFQLGLFGTEGADDQKLLPVVLPGIDIVLAAMAEEFPVAAVADAG